MISPLSDMDLPFLEDRGDLIEGQRESRAVSQFYSYMVWCSCPAIKEQRSQSVWHCGVSGHAGSSAQVLGQVQTPLVPSACALLGWWQQTLCSGCCSHRYITLGAVWFLCLKSKAGACLNYLKVVEVGGRCGAALQAPCRVRP